ncbi:hypothetical protein CLOM_g18118 [Closterium sp. NIES-68]|nr:hypothetical protein CLOM_g18118 [Closterium sp. NIES-68]GJP68259.1 hypothetical protein CLOP_g24983 [Closterium sp. NIES-67]
MAPAPPLSRRCCSPRRAVSPRVTLPLLLLLLLVLLAPGGERGGGGDGVRRAMAGECPLIGQGMDPYSAGLVGGKTPVYLSVLLKKLIKVDEIQNSYSAYFTFVITWRDLRVNDTVAINKALTAIAPSLTGLATDKCKPNASFSGFNVSQKDDCLKNNKQNNLPQMDGCSKPCTPAGITCCDSIWIPSLTIPNVILYPQDRYQTESIYFFGDQSSDFSAVDREVVLQGTFSSPFNFRRFPFDSQTLLLSLSVEGSGFYLVGSNYGRETEQGGTSNSGGSSFVHDEVTGWKIKNALLNCNPVQTTISTSSTYHPDDPWTSIPAGGSDSAASSQSTMCVFTIDLTRTSSVYIFSVLLPVILSVYLTFTSFVAKPEDLEIRCGACVTLFLALAAIQFVIDSQLPHTSYITKFGYLMIVSYVIIWLCTMEALVVFCIAERIEKNVIETVMDTLPPALSMKLTSTKEDQAAEEQLMGGAEAHDGKEPDTEAIAEAAAARRAAADDMKQNSAVPSFLKFRLFGYHLKGSNPDRAKEGNYRLAVRIDFICFTIFFIGYTILWIVLYTA